MENRCRAHEREKPSPVKSPKSNGGEFLQTPAVIPRSEPYPTTFVQADTSSFKQVVQMLTGSSDPKGDVMKKQSFKLYERRGQAQTLKKRLMIIPGTRHHQETLSPSILDFPKLALNSPHNLHPSPREPQLLPLFPLLSDS